MIKKKTTDLTEKRINIGASTACQQKQNLQQNGITLVALVVTIIVLLILAGVTLTLALSNNGVMDRAQYASNIWSNATRDERTSLDEMSSEIARLSQTGSGEETVLEVDYGEKTAATVVQGDTVSIGTEQFMVLINDGTKIMAMPYYNITLDTTNPVQAPSGTDLQAEVLHIGQKMKI